MSIEDLRAAWNGHPEWQVQGNRAAREAALPQLLDLIKAFKTDALDLTDFRRSIDSFSKRRETGVWGYKGNAGVMFFTMFWKAAPDELKVALRATISAPVDDEAARAAINNVREVVRAARERTGNTRLHEAFVPFFLSFFWEAQDKGWPLYHPTSREGLERFGLMATDADVSDAYITFRTAMRLACEALAADLWDVEEFFWNTRNSTALSPAPEEATGNAGPPPGHHDDLYASLAASGLTIADELVTRFVLSLLSKRFIILAGISGTGKTQLPLQFARYLSEIAPGAAVVDPVPDSDEHAMYLVVTKSTLRYGALTIPRALVDLIELPERGAGAAYTVALPTGSEGPVRIQNVGFADTAAQFARLNLRGAAKLWISDLAQPGDVVKVALNEAGQPTAIDHQARSHSAAVEPVKRHELIAVRSDWTDPRGLLGYWNPLTASYASTQLVDLCLRAAEDPDHPYLVILDEMNLARVEYYFSDFLSALESGESIPLFRAEDEESEAEVPASLTIPGNVLFVGTVNIDETTHAFSPKVLDRANVIEFDDVDLPRHLGLAASPDVTGNFRLSHTQIEPSILVERPKPLQATIDGVTEDSDLMADLLRIHAILETARRHFGYRVANEVMAFVGHAVERVEGEPEPVARTALDHQLSQKVLPKLTGGRELQPALTQLLDVCLHGETTAAPSVETSLSDATATLGSSDEAQTASSEARYPRSARKLRTMLRRLDATGYVSFLE